MSMFDPDTFLAQTIEQANDTKVIPCPAGEFLAFIKDFKARQWSSRKDPSVSGVALDVTWTVDNAEVKALLDRDEVTVKQGIMLDMTEQGALDMGKGKNVGLGRLREALGLNVPGQAFSFAMLNGQAAKITVSHRVDGEDTYAEVKMVAKV